MWRVTDSCTLGAGGSAVGWAGSVFGGGAMLSGGTGDMIAAAGASTFEGGATHGGGSTLGGGATLGGGGVDAVGAGAGELVI